MTTAKEAGSHMKSAVPINAAVRAAANLQKPTFQISPGASRGLAEPQRNPVDASLWPSSSIGAAFFVAFGLKSL